MTLPVHLVTELKKYVDKPVKHWHYAADILPKEGKLLLIVNTYDAMFLAKLKLKDFGYWKGIVFEDEHGIDWEICEVIKWMYIPEE